MMVGRRRVCLLDCTLIDWCCFVCVDHCCCCCCTHFSLYFILLPMHYRLTVTKPNEYGIEEEVIELCPGKHYISISLNVESGIQQVCIHSSIHVYYYRL